MNPALPADTLAPLLPTETQRMAARMAQDAFTAVFRMAAGSDAAEATDTLREIETRCSRWCQAGDTEDGRAGRTALLIAGLDQWGLAYATAFGMSAIPALSELLGTLRNALEPAAEARFQQYFERLAANEGDAADFKIELRRNIHLALWHALVACTGESEVEALLAALGSLMVTLTRRMPELGWRLVADALAGIQIRLLEFSGEESALASERTRRLFEALRGNLPEEQYRSILAHSAQVVIAWQQSKRPRQ
jgi:hypothetical protein